MNKHVEAMAFLHAHGLEVEPEAINTYLRAAVKKVQAFYHAEPGQEGLTEAEWEVARSGGLEPEPKGFRHGDPLLKGIVAYASLMHTGLTTAQAARRLGVSDARIRQRLHDRTLFAIRDGRSWRLPLFQFTEQGEVPGWGEVSKALPRDISPVAVEQWLNLPHSELVDGPEEKPMTPRHWLMEGRPAHSVATQVLDLE